MNKTFVSIFLLLCLALLPMFGCKSPEEVKNQVDQTVYASIDRHWQDEHGTPANYRISDTAPQANDVNTFDLIDNLGVLTLPQAVALATGQNRLYQDQREALYISGLNLRLTRHQFERRFFGTGRLGYAGNETDELLSAEATIGFNHLLADGTEIGLALTGAWVDVLSGDLRGGLASILGVAIRKPLLRGSKREIVLEGLTQAERDVLYQVRTFNRYRQQFVVSVISEYYRTLLLLDWFLHAKDNIEVLRELDNRCSILYEKGHLNQVERDQVRQEVMQAEDATMIAQKLYLQALDQFKRTLALAPHMEFTLDPQALTKLKQTPLTIPEVPDETVIQTAQARRLDLVNEADRIQDAERKILVAKDRMRGELNIIGGGGATSNRIGNPNTLQFYEDQARLGLEFDLPLDRVAEENEYRLALIYRSQQQRRYDDLADQISLEVRQAYRNLKQGADRYQLQSEAHDLAKERLRVANLLFDHKRVSSRRILDAQSDYVTAQNRQSQAIVNYAIALLEFYRDTSVLQVKPDGMWQL